MAGATLIASDHDVVLDEQVIEDLAGRAEIKQFPYHVFAVIGDQPDSALVLFTDEELNAVYVVPAYLAEEVLRR